MTDFRKHLLVDANVLIDYMAVEPSILRLAGRYLGENQVLSTILGEVDGLDIVECERLGFRIIDYKQCR